MTQSAGILAYRLKGGMTEVFLVHPGGPFFKNKDSGAWSIPKGEPGSDEDLLTAALREFNEETGSIIGGNFLPLTPVKQKSGKIVYAWAVEAGDDVHFKGSNSFKLEWPPHSGRIQEFPEIDKGGWLPFDIAKIKINSAQACLLDELAGILNR